MKKIANLLFFMFLGLTYAQNTNSKDISISPYVDGTIVVPKNIEKPPLVIIVGDSGPTDRDGNQHMQQTNTLKYLAQGLYEKGIATFRYDKRIVKQIKNRTINEESIRFDDFITDAIATVTYFNKANAFSKIFIIGHGQGSLVGMIAAQDHVDGYISIGGAGQELDDMVVEQIEQQSPGLKNSARTAFDDMRAQGVARNYSRGLASIFRPQIQPFMLTWMQFNPNTEIKKLDIPIMIIAGDKDLQVQLSEADKLKEAKPNATLHIIPNMNHILKIIEGDDIENSKSYNEPSRPVAPELIDLIATFILKE